MSKKKQPDTRPAVRCAIYTRVSTSEQADMEYSSLQSQRETGEAYIAAQKHAGWECLCEHYDDGGFTGANTDRPAFRRLLADVEDGKIDCVVCYKLDRLTRSLVDFARTLEIFERHEVAVVSVTQAFDTSTATGKLMMHILMSFAEFERQLISERTRDKIAAARRKGKWSGGMPLLGYSVCDTKLVVDEVEAERVRQIFGLYLEHQSLIETVKELSRRGWTTKCWTTRKGTRRGGCAFTKTRLYQLLTNPTYIAKVRYKKEIHSGEHAAIVDDDVFRRVQATLQRNGLSGGSAVRNKCGALLRGLLRCASCDCAMGHTYTAKGKRRYRYYVCRKAQQRGWDTCPSPSVPAGELERFVVDEIKCIGRDPDVVAATLARVGAEAEEAIERLTAERRSLERQRRDDEAELRRLATAKLPDERRATYLADLQEAIGAADRRLTEIADELAALEQSRVAESDVAQALAEFDDVWNVLAPREQARVLELLIDQISYDGRKGSISISLRPSGIKALAGDLYDEEAA